MSKAPRVGVFGSGVLLVLRAVLGGLFVLAAYQKLFASPFSSQSFYEAVSAFKVTDDIEQKRLATFIIPWIELFSGLALIAGLWTRAAAVVINLLLAVFIAGIVSVTLRGLSVDCSCFGNFKLLCGNDAIDLFKGTKPVGWCKVGEDAAMLLMGAALWVYGGGWISLDEALAKPKPAKASPKD
jgi:uncharacterized membrane protein YphA (DoxX/SURF4 family)